MTKSKYAGWSRDRLEKENQRLSAAKEKIREEQRELNAELDLVAARERVELMTDAERQSLAQVIGPNGIAPTSKVGTPGAKA